MESFYLIDYLRENHPIDRELLDALKWQLDSRIYHYGHQFKCELEECENESKFVAIKEKFKDIFRYYYGCLKAYPENDKLKILSNTYFTYNQELENLGFNVFLSPWIKQFARGYPPKHIKNELNYLKSFLASKKFNEIIGQSFLDKIMEAEKTLKQYYRNNNFRALCVPYGLPFFENWNIKIFKKINRPSFICLHGLTQITDDREDNQSDYLIVWGEKIREIYIKAGLDKNKIFVSGHPYYQKFKRKDLRFSFENVLVLGYPAISFHYYSTGVMLKDRGISILYLYSIQKILQKIGVKQVRLRLHPCENPKWYQKYIDNGFYKIERTSLRESFVQSSLIIGNRSTTVLESIYYGTSYIVYEPSINNLPWGVGQQVAPPFDGSDSRVPVAKSEEDLLYILKNKIQIDPSVFNDYIKTPFDISFMKKLILEH